MKKGTNIEPSGSDSDPEQKRILGEIINNVKMQTALMRRSIENEKVMEALKHCSNILNELRTSSLSPKFYSELYFFIFDCIQHLTPYLRELHLSGKQNLADLYELVQYAGSVVTRMYLMITVGSTYISLDQHYKNSKVASETSESIPVKEVLLDMLEMARGVQHPIRGLFLRYYLGQMTKDHLPTGTEESTSGSVDDSIHFLLSNFTEMNKLWVRMQHQGLSKDRVRREEERRDLRTLVGSNLLRLSALDGVTISNYHNIILPSMLSQVVSCKDALAQEYLMEATVQAFSDEYHVNTLSMIVSTLGKLHPRVAIRGIITSLADRISSYYIQKKLEDIKENGFESQNIETTGSNSNDIHSTENVADNQSVQNPVSPKKDSDIEKINKSEDVTVSSADISKGDLETQEPEEGDKEQNSEGNLTESISKVKIDEDESKIEKDKSLEINPESVGNEKDEKSSDSQHDSISAVDESNEPENKKLRDNETSEKLDDNVKVSEINTEIQAEKENKVKKDELDENVNDGIKIFEDFWDSIQKLLVLRSDLYISDVVAICNSMLKMALSCAPETIELANQVLEFAEKQISSKKTSSVNVSPNFSSMNSPKKDNTQQSIENGILGLILTPLRIYTNPLDVLKLSNYLPLLESQPIKTRRGLSIALLTILLQREIMISDPKTAADVLKLCVYNPALDLSSTNENSEDAANELGLLSRLVHSLKSDDSATYTRLLETARNSLSVNTKFIKIIFPAIVSDATHLVALLLKQVSPEEVKEDESCLQLVLKLLRFIRSALEQLVSAVGDDNKGSVMCFNMYLLVGQSISSQSQLYGIKSLENAAFDFYTEAMGIFENVSFNSHGQYLILVRLVGSIYSSRIFGAENYGTLSERCVFHANKLLKRPDQCRMYLVCANLWWRTLTDYELWDLGSPDAKSQYETFNNSTKVLECLEKSVILARSCLDSDVILVLYTEILNNYIVLYERRCFGITPKLINELISEIKAFKSKNDLMLEQESEATSGVSGKNYNAAKVNTLFAVLDKDGSVGLLERFLGRTLDYIKTKQREQEYQTSRSHYDENGAGDQDMNEGRLYLNQENPIDYSAIKL
ncbi:hypothetical protein BB559_007010 [Furculomyces boomerangus]|uniref:Vacuolar protein sorting-associated protein 35 n=2 Tax=Harpellales TaxID=61421 RepID=A0A2T9XZC2_9FUNG|nr:hypothetical protein BB559_007010 [Furculomyces boomerangus]PWA01244.1 hypothetical protein BB558_002687 [Smittium angustum]